MRLWLLLHASSGTAGDRHILNSLRSLFQVLHNIRNVKLRTVQTVKALRALRFWFVSLVSCMVEGSSATLARSRQS